MLWPAAIALVCALLLLAVPASGSGATWTATTSATAESVGTGLWCTTPDPATSGRYIRLSSIATTVGTNQRMAIIPVANNTAWGGGTGVAGLGVRLWGCQTAPVGSIRITAWSNPSTPAAVTWLSGGSVAPSSRLDPTSGLGAQLKTLAQGATVSASFSRVTSSGSGDLRRYSWLVAGGRTSASPTTDPAQCTYGTSLLSASCTATLTNSANADSTFAQVFNVSPWTGTTTTPTLYTARTWATQTAAGWGATDAWLNVTCGVFSFGCGTNATPTTLTGTAAADATLLASTNGNLMQWVVVQWTATAPPPPDLVVEVFLQ